MNTEAGAVEDAPGDFWKKNKTLVKVLVARVVHPASRLAANYSRTALREACARVVDKLRVSAELMVVPKKARRADVETFDGEERRAEREAAPSVTSAPASSASSSAASSSAASSATSSSSSSTTPSTETPASPADDGHRMLVYFQQPPLVRCRLSVALEEGWLCGPAPHNEMVSRRKILSRSRDDLNLDSTFAVQEEEEDVWYQRDKLYKDHIQEVLDKWTQIDDEIWAKVIVLERNRRVAKAYARAPVLTINGSDDGFDGFRIGLCGFDNPMRDAKTEEVKRHIGQGVKVKMDDQGNILVKRVSKSNVYVKSTAGSPDEETSIGNDVLKLPGCALEMEKPVKLFDMKKFQQNVSRELRRAYPDRRRLECQCLSAVAFVKNEPELLDCPIWVLVVNVVAMDMLKSKLPPVKRPVDIRNRPRIPIPDEDPYSVAGSGGSSGGSSGGGAGGVGGGTGGLVAAARDQLIQQQQAARRDRPPKLPPRDTAYPQDIPKPDYDDVDEDSRLKPFPSSRSSGRDKAKDSKKYDDPYYCGLRARVPKFVTSRVPPPKEAAPPPPPSVVGRFAAFPPQAHVQAQQALYHQHHHNHHPHHGHHPPPTMWHARSFDSGMDSEALESPYNHIYGRLPIPTRAYIPPTPRAMFVGDWD